MTFAMVYWLISLFTTIIGALSIHYLFRIFNFFKRHDVVHLSPIPLLGNVAPAIFRQLSTSDLVRNLYNAKLDAKYCGFYVMTQPAIMLRDPELIKETLIKNFHRFSDRHGFSDLNDFLFTKNIFSLRGQRWHDMRKLLSAAFTSNKMKNMFSSISDCAANFAKFLLAADGRSIDTKDAFTKFTNDIIVVLIFGMKTDSMKNPTNKFYVYGKNSVNFLGTRGIKFIFSRISPTFMRIFGFRLISDETADFFKNSVRTTFFAYDTDNSIARPNIIQLMADLNSKSKSVSEMTMEDVTAQAFAYYFAGFETSATTLCFIANEIAVHPDVQEKLQQEIDEVLNGTNGEITYEATSRLEYLDAVINEGLRMYAPIVVERICGEDFELPPTLPSKKPFIMKKGMAVYVPIHAIHHDEKYYDEPERFRPERFLDNKNYQNSSYYMPFGIGPRMCAASRFALLKMKVVMFHLLARYELRPCVKTTIPMRFCKRNLNMVAEGGFWLNIRLRNNVHPTIESAMFNKC